MLLYADEDFAFPAVEELRVRGYDVLTAQEDGQTAMPDAVILARTYAAEAHLADGRGLGTVAGPAGNPDLVEACYLHREIARFLLSCLSPSVTLSVVKKPVAGFRNLTLIS